MSVLAELAEVCGAQFARPGTPADVAAGVPAGLVAAPGDGAQLAAVLRLAADRGLAVVPRGAGTKLDWGAPPSTVDIMLDLSRLAGLREQVAEPATDDGDRTATFGAGTALREADALLAPLGQRLALDPPSARSGATLGGVLATAETGPLRQLTGPLKDLVLSVEYVDAGGAVHQVAGAEAAALFGSLGTLGVISSVTVQLHPRPPSTVWVRRSVHSPAELDDLVLLLETTPLSVVAVEADWPAVDPVAARVPRQRLSADVDPDDADARPPGPGSLAVQIEGTEAGVADRARTAVTLLGGDAAAASMPPPWWGRNPFRPGGVALRLTVPNAALRAVGYSLRDSAGSAAALRGSVGAGVVLAGLPEDLTPERVAGIVEAVRHTLLARGGSCVVLRAPAAVHEAVRRSDLAISLARRSKERYDPAGRLSPGRLPLPGE